MQPVDPRERNRVPFVVALNSAIVAEKNAQKTIDEHREKETEARAAGNGATYEAQMRVYQESLKEASQRVRKLRVELANYDELVANRQYEASAQEDEQVLQMFRTWLRGAQLVMDRGTPEEKEALRQLLKKASGNGKS